MSNRIAEYCNEFWHKKYEDSSLSDSTTESASSDSRINDYHWTRYVQTINIGRSAIPKAFLPNVNSKCHQTNAKRHGTTNIKLGRSMHERNWYDQMNRLYYVSQQKTHVHLENTFISMSFELSSSNVKHGGGSISVGPSKCKKLCQHFSQSGALLW